MGTELSLHHSIVQLTRYDVLVRHLKLQLKTEQTKKNHWTLRERY